MAILALAALVTGCAGSQAPPKGVVDHIQDYFGGVAADEPRAVLVARDVLSSGGTAADAAVALYFALSVTLPSSAGLGGGGVCVVHGKDAVSVEAIDFSARAPQRGAAKGRWAVAVPGSVRGMFALHARYGSLRWANLVRHAERMARFGFPVSRALASKIAVGMERLRADPVSGRIFGGARGVGLAEGETLRQLDLATMLVTIRSRGPGDFYNGETARRLVEGIREAGGSLDIQDLRQFKPVWIPVLKAGFEDHTVFFPGAPITGGEIAHALWRGLDNAERYGAASGPERHRIIAQAGAAAYRDMALRVANDFGSTGFVVMDSSGGVVACNLSMNALFGNGRTIRGTGILAAPPMRPGRAGTSGLAPMAMINVHTGDAFLAAAASASAAAPLILVSTVMAALQDGVSLEEALETIRLRPGTRNGTVLVEPGAGDDVRAALARAGLKVEQAGALGRVNIMFCRDGMGRAPKTCDVRSDRRGFGYAINAEF